jgi:hypothetical protein
MKYIFSGRLALRIFPGCFLPDYARLRILQKSALRSKPASPIMIQSRRPWANPTPSKCRRALPFPAWHRGVMLGSIVLMAADRLASGNHGSTCDDRGDTGQIADFPSKRMRSLRRGPKIAQHHSVAVVTVNRTPTTECAGRYHVKTPIG